MLPDGAVALNSININNLYYLVGSNVVSANFGKGTSFDNRGVPLDNMYYSEYDSDLLSTLHQALPSGQTNLSGVFQLFPNTNSASSDIHIDGTETSLTMTFLSEGAGYQNAIGYYFFVRNDEDTVVLLQSAPESELYYNPTIIFPNTTNTFLASGSTREIKGNLANGKFRNIHVGFFVVPNGFRRFQGVVADQFEILHTTHSLNPNANHNTVQGIQILMFDYPQGRYILGVEDIKRPAGDNDFNDLLVRIQSDPPIIRASESATVLPLINSHNMLQYTPTGIVVKLDSAIKSIADANDFVDFYRLSEYTDKSVHFSQQDVSVRDYAHSIFSALVFRYQHTVQPLGSHQLLHHHRFYKDDFLYLDNTDYVFQIFDLSDNSTSYVVEIAGSSYTNAEIISALQNILTDYIFSLRPCFIQAETLSIVRPTDNWEITQSTGIHTNTFSTTAWGEPSGHVLALNVEDAQIEASATGDPYVRTFGSSAIQFKIPGSTQNYRLFNDSNMRVVVNASVTGLDTEEQQALKALGRFREACFFDRFVIILDGEILEFDRKLSLLRGHGFQNMYKTSKLEVLHCPLQKEQQYCKICIFPPKCEWKIELLQFKSCEVVNGIRIYIPASEKGVEGLLVNNFHPSNYRIKKLTYVGSIKPKKKITYKKHVTDKW